MSIHLRKSFSLLPRIFNRNIIKKNQQRFISYSSSLRDGAYDGQGKTTVEVINKEYEYGLMVDTVNQIGFRLNNGNMILGPLAMFNKAIFSWNIAEDTDIAEDSLSLFLHLEPQLDVLVIGLSDFEVNHFAVAKVIAAIRKKYSYNIELLPTERAIAAFNFLVGEGRIVGAGFLPPKKINFTDKDYIDTVNRHKDLYKLDIKYELF